MSLYIVANIDGNVISSTDGINWSASFNTGININKVAIGPNKIIYAGTNDSGEFPGLYQTSAWNQTPTLVQGTDQYYYNEVHYLGNKFVAVGYQTGSPTLPAFAYSNDGVNWTIGQIDPEYAIIDGGEGGEGNNIEFTDVGYNGIGYFITSRVSGEGLAGGFYTTDLSQELNQTNWVDIEKFPVDAQQLVYAHTHEGGEGFFGGWSVFSDDNKTWFATSNQDPSEPWDFVLDVDLSEVLSEQTGLDNLSIAEATIGVLNGYVTWMVSTTGGQIIWWPHVPAGPFVSIPNPHTVTVVSVNNLNPLEINVSPGEFVPSNNEKIKIEGSTGLLIDGVYFVENLGSNNYRLYHDVLLGNAVDASSLTGTYDSGSGIAKLSRGTYIDALGYGDGKFFAGNDDEEVFVCSSLAEDFGGEGGYPELVWTKVDDRNNSFAFWNDVSYGNFIAGCSTTTVKLELSPDNYKYDGEGSMDTAIIVNSITGERTSIQRTGYFEFVDSCANRKVISAKDGEIINNVPVSLVDSLPSILIQN